MFQAEKTNIRNFCVLKLKTVFVKAIDHFLINVIICKVLAPELFLMFVESIGNLLSSASL